MFIYRIPTDLSRTKSSIPEILSPMRMPEFDSHFQLHPSAITDFPAVFARSSSGSGSFSFCQSSMMLALIAFGIAVSRRN